MAGAEGALLRLAGRQLLMYCNGRMTSLDLSTVHSYCAVWLWLYTLSVREDRDATSTPRSADICLACTFIRIMSVHTALLIHIHEVNGVLDRWVTKLHCWQPPAAHPCVMRSCPAAAARQGDLGSVL